MSAADTRRDVSQAQVRDLVRVGWAHRPNVTFADAVYVASAEQLNGVLRTGDHKLAATPTSAIPVLDVPLDPTPRPRRGRGRALST